MVMVRTTNTVLRSRWWNSTRVQVGGGFFFAVLLPTSVLALFYENFFATKSAHWAMIGNAVGSLASIYLVRNLALYPGIKGVYYSLPSVVICYSLLFSIFLIFRIDYSRILLVSGGFLTLGWLYVAQFRAARGPPLRVGVVALGDVNLLGDVPNLQVNYLRSPTLSVPCDLLVADFRANLPDEWEAFLADCALAGLPVLHFKQLHESLVGKVDIEHLSENNFGSLIPFIGYLRLRRMVDFLGAVVFGILLLPALLAIAAAIRLTSPGPALFRQERIGYRGKPFSIAKFRTMRMGAPGNDARLDASTRENDPRITPIGRFLRRTRIDELPQIINILRGEMSWIGPRPEAMPLARWYEQELPFYRYRHIVPPGITGWAQVNQGHVVEIDQVTVKLQYDFYYIKSFSPWLDALIVVKTLTTVLTGFGSK